MTKSKGPVPKPASAFCDIGDILDEVNKLLPALKSPKFKTMVTALAKAVKIAGPADISMRLADTAGIPVEQARAVVRGLREMARPRENRMLVK